MLKHALAVVAITIVASILIRAILQNVPITATWLQDLSHVGGIGK